MCDGATPNFIATQVGYGAPGAGTLAPWTLYNFSARYQVTHQLELSFLVDNVFNKMPPFDNSYFGYLDQPYNSLNYNNLGRSYFVGASYKFGK